VTTFEVTGRRTSVRDLVRVAAGVAAVLAAILSLGYLLRWPAATGTWPFPVTPLTYTFLSAFSMGLVAALAWVAATGELVGLAGIGLTIAVGYGAMGAVLAGMVAGPQDLAVNLVVAVVLCALGVAVLLYGLRQPPRDQRSTPRPLPAVYLVVSALLLTLGVPLLLRWPDVMPWNLELDSGALIGALFTGSAAYFAFGALRRGWANAAGPLVALLAYDLILTVPLVLHVPVARAQHVTVLLLYIAVLVSSGAVGIWMFAVDRRTRWGTRSEPA
jgi:hypothetical protein